MVFLVGLLGTNGALQATQAHNNDERRTGLILVGAAVVCGIIGVIFKV